MKLPFGKYKNISLELIPSGYLKWLLEQDWFEEKFSDEFTAVEEVMSTRDYEQSHFYEDKVHI